MEALDGGEAPDEDADDWYHAQENIQRDEFKKKLELF